jgi:hypothetical protein
MDTTAGIQEIEQRMEQLPRMREHEIKQLSCFDPITLTLSRWERKLMGQQ